VLGMPAVYTIIGLAAMVLIGSLVLWLERRGQVHPCAICDQPGRHRCRGMWVCGNHRQMVDRIHRRVSASGNA